MGLRGRLSCREIYGPGVDHVDRAVVAPETRSCRPSGESWNISGLPPIVTCRRPSAIAESMTGSCLRGAVAHVGSDRASRAKTTETMRPSPGGMNQNPLPSGSLWAGRPSRPGSRGQRPRPSGELFMSIGGHRPQRSPHRSISTRRLQLERPRAHSLLARYFRRSM